MKKTILLSAILALFCACNNLPEGFYQLNGKLSNAGDSYIYLQHGGKKDSVQVKNGKFCFRDSLHRADLYTIIVGEKRCPFFITKAGEITFNGDANTLEKATVNGEPVAEWNSYMAQVQPIDDSITTLTQKRKQEGLSEEDRQSIVFELQAARGKRDAVSKEFIASHPGSMISPWLIVNKYMYSIPTDANELPSLYNSLSDEAKISFYGVKIKESIDAAARVAVGAKAPAFTQKDKDGKELSLADYSGKYVILDFWGSWCTPCRKSHPHLVELYKKYKKENFEIVGLAGNESKYDAWTKAIKDDGLTWPQINVRENDAKQELLALYNIRAFPTKILLDPSGVILVNSIGGSDEIEAKLKEVFGK